MMSHMDVFRNDESYGCFPVGRYTEAESRHKHSRTRGVTGATHDSATKTSKGSIGTFSDI